jgi:hypothetical protein
MRVHLSGYFKSRPPLIRVKPANGDGLGRSSSYPVNVGLGKWPELAAPRLGNFRIADHWLKMV